MSLIEPRSTVRSLWRGDILISRPPPTMRQLLREVAEEYGLTIAQLESSERSYNVSHPRQDFMWRCRQVKWANGKARYSYPQIARFLGGMDHTTVMHGVRAHETRLEAN